MRPRERTKGAESVESWAGCSSGIPGWVILRYILGQFYNHYSYNMELLSDRFESLQWNMALSVQWLPNVLYDSHGDVATVC